jgi:hypothetical protein
MSGRPAAVTPRTTRPTKRPSGLFGISKYIDREALQASVNLTPLPIASPIESQHTAAPSPSLPPPPPVQAPSEFDYEQYEEVVKEALVLENQAFGASFRKLCILFLVFVILLILGITAITAVVQSHGTHGGSVIHEGVGVVESNAAYVLTDAGTAVSASISTYYYSLVLGSEVQQWQSYPRDANLPELNSTLQNILSYDVCCYAEKPHAWLCSNGHVLVDMYTFESKLQDVVDGDGAVQCLIYLNSKHLAGSSCTLEVKVRNFL